MRGGMEKVAFELCTYMSRISNVRLISYGGPKKFLPIVLPSFFARSVWNILTKKIDVIFLHDGLLSPLGVILKISGKPIAIKIHGLDITYKNPLYQYLIPKCIKKLDIVICISNATKEECIKRGIPEEKIVIIPNGISSKLYINEDKKVLKEKLAKKINLPLGGKKILLSVARLVERKGFHWFVDNGIPHIIEREKNVVYLIVGNGPYKNKITEAISKRKMGQYVLMLDKVDDETLKLLYNASDIFIMPNIPVSGDMEGFGIVALEAVSCGLPAVASRLEGIQDAIKNKENGFLVEPYHTNEFVDAIFRLLEDDDERKNFGDRARKFTVESYNWEKITKSYLASFAQ